MNETIQKVGLRDFQIKRLADIEAGKKGNVIQDEKDLTKIIKEAYFSMLKPGDGVITTFSTAQFYDPISGVEDDNVKMAFGPYHKFEDITAMYIKRGDMELIYDERKYKA